MAGALELEGDAFGPYVAQALDQLKHLTPQRILDIGSGPGVAACQLAEKFGDAEVIAVDGSAELLARAETRAKRLGIQLHSRQAEFPAGLKDLPRADLVWSAQVVHHVGDQLGALKDLAALLRPGGMLAIVEGGLPVRSLPRDIGFGKPGLQYRLDVATNERFDRMRAELPESVAVVEDWPAMLRAAGLVDAHSRTFLVDHPAPLPDGPRAFIRLTVERQRAGLAEFLDADDLATLDRLLDPTDPASVDLRPDLFLLTAKTVHFARRDS